MNPYEILGLHKEVTERQIKDKYRELSKKHHPDVGGNASVFTQINIAYKILIDPKKREQFDKDGFITPDEQFFKQQVRSRIIRIVEDWADRLIQKQIPTNTTLIRYFNVQIKEGRKHISNTIDHLKSSQELLKTCFKKLSYNETQESIAHTIIQQKVHLLNADIQNNKNEIKIIELLAEELEKYILEEEDSEIIKMTTGASEYTFTF